MEKIVIKTGVKAGSGFLGSGTEELAMKIKTSIKAGNGLIGSGS